MSAFSVKPLNFIQKAKFDYYTAETPFGRYIIRPDISEDTDDVFWWWAFYSLDDVYHDQNILFMSDEMPTLWTKDACMADAQKHWNELVLSLIEDTRHQSM